VRPNILRLDQIGPGDTYVLYFDGSSGWEIPPEKGSLNRTSGIVTELAGGELEFAKGYLSGFDLTLWLADRNPAYAISSPGPNVVRISWNNQANATDITIDAASGLPLKQAGISLADPSKPVAAEMLYSEWSEIEGVKFPTKKSNFHNGVKLAEITSMGIRINQGLVPAGLAIKPEHLEPNMHPRYSD
jgi:hypothetical protein